ncbi:unnamed protein product [Adineta ricciae]|uniref:Ankyrin n=1 Tax=Adineta ricciae TaxID=249248 RepID=A0A814RES7_ADIRI|nr:unnamed protein product [Adineta ricciae]
MYLSAENNGLNALHLASKEGHVNIVQELLSRGANVNAATKKGNTALHIASLAGQEEVVKLLVKYNGNINCQSQNGFSPLYMAAQENHLEVVKFLLANGANQSLATEDGFTPLAVSLQQGHDKVVAILLENDSKGSKVRLPALHIAAKKNDTKAAALLLQGDSQPDLNYKEGGFVNCTTKSGFTPLHIAAHYGNLEVAQLLIARGADVNYAASQNITPLHVASKWGKENLVKLLLEKGAQIDAKTKDGLTPLHCAARSGHDQVVDLLLESGAPFGAKTKNGLSALHMAAQGDHVDAARILLYYKSTLVDDVSSDYLSALHVASHCGNYNVAKLLCERRADVNAKALNGFSCLHIACKKNRLKLVELLISNDADIEGKTESGLTSLHVAAFVGSHDIVVYLLQHEANIDAVTIRGETPLHLATRNNQVDIVQTLLRFGATVDAKAKEAQTCLHLATRLGNIEIVSLLLRANAFVDNETKDGYSSLHIAAKEGHEEIASLLIDHGANLNLFTKRNFSALHICSKYGNIKVANLLLQKGATPDIQGKNDLTPLHCAVHYNHSNVALLLLQHGASPHVTARNGYTPLHIAAKKNALDIAEMLLEYNANTNAQSSGGFTPLHLSCQDGHSDMTYLLLANHADPNIASKCHLTPLHLCAQEDRVKCAEALVNKQANIDAQTLSGYTSLHVACHFGQINMVRYLLQLGANVNIETNLMFTPLHSAAQQGHVMIVKLLLEHGASPNKTNKHGMTALSIAQRLGYISVVEELKVVTETTIASKHELITEERYKIQAPEVSHEEHPLTDSEDETDMLGDASSNVHMQYLREGVLMTEAEENKLNQTSFNKEEPEYPMLAGKDHWTESRDNLHDHQTPALAPQNLVADNEVITKPRHGGERFQCRSFLVSFLVDARGGAMRGCRHSGVRVIIPAKRASMPTRITCRFVKREKLTVPPPINEGEALAARVLEVGPVGCKFLGPVILEIPHFASLRNYEREIVVLRSDNGEKWTEHTGPITDEAVREVFGDTVDSEDLQNADELHSRRITRIITNDFPRFFALITRMRQEAQFIDEQGGLLTSTIIPTVQAHIPEKALQKRIRVSLHVLPISAQLVQRSYGSRIHVSPVVTVEPRRRKFHKPITITIPLPNKTSTSRKHSHPHQHGNAYTSDSQTLRLLCSITGGTHAAQFDDITGHTPLTFSNDCATFTTTVSARFWLVDAQGVSDVLKLAHEIYREATSVPYMSRFIVFAKRHDPNEALVRIFCITDDKENKTLEMQEHFTEIAKSKEVEVVNGNSIYIDLQSTNLQTIIKTNEQLTLVFRAFKENRLPCVVRLRDQEQEPSGRLIFSKDNGKLTSIQRTTSITMTNGQASALSSTTVIDPQTLQTICNLNILIPAYDKDLLENEERLRALHSVEHDRNSESWKSDDMYRKGEIRLTDIARLLGSDWPALAAELELSEDEVTKIMDEFGENASLHMLRYWLKSRGTDATGNCLQQALRKIGKENIVHNCVFNIEWVTDAAEKELAKSRLHSRGGSVDGIAAGGRRLDEGFESDDEYERRRHGKSTDLDDPYHASSKQQTNADLAEGRTTPTANEEFQSKKSSKKFGDFGIVNIVQEATPILPDNQPAISSVQSDTLTDQSKTTTQQLAEQTSQALDDIPSTRVNPTPVGERFIKSRIIPDQARAIANAFKHAVVRPLKRTITKKKSDDGAHSTEPPLTSSHQPYVHSLSTNDHFDQQGNEFSISSCESISQTTFTPPPAKPPRQNDESDSLSSVDITPIPPAKPPRHFSLYSNKSLMQQTDTAVKKVLNLADAFGIVSNDDTDISILRTTPPDMSQSGNLHVSDSLQTLQSFIVDASRLVTNTDTPVMTKSFEFESEQPRRVNLISSSVEKSAKEIVPVKIIHFATELAETILRETQECVTTSTPSSKTSSNNTSSFPHSIVTTHISPTPPSLARPLMFVSFQTQPGVTPKIVSPLREIVTIKPTPIVTTSVTVVSTPTTLLSSTTSVNANEDETDQPVTSASNSNRIFNQLESTENTSRESNANFEVSIARDNTVFFPENADNITSVRSFSGNYDNSHVSNGSFQDDNNHQPQDTSPSTTRCSTPSSSSTATLYESLDNFSTSTATSPTYVSAASTFNTGVTLTPTQHFNSDTSDDDTIESLSQASTPTVELMENTIESLDECDISYATNVLAQDNPPSHHQDNLDPTTLQSSIGHEAQNDSRNQ